MLIHRREVEIFILPHYGIWSACKDERGKSLWIDVEWFPGHAVMWKNKNAKKSVYSILHFI